MNKKKEIIDIVNLKAGMITSDDIIYNGTTLVGKGVVLTKQMLDKLKSLYAFDKVEVISSNKVSKEAIAIEEAKNTLKNVSNSVEYIFTNSTNLKSSNTNEINEYSIYMHSVNVAVLSYMLGKWANMSETKLHALIYASLLHDFGKTKIDKKIIDKAGKLTEEEFEIIKNHPVLAYNDIKDIPFISQSVLYAVLMHHERCDGSGYPLNLKGDQIHEFAKIIAIADTFDAINSNRCYKERKKPLQSLKIIKEESLTKLDYSLCNTFLKGLESYYVGQLCLLSNNKTCKIIQLNLNDIEAPLVFSNDEFIDLSKSRNLSIIKLLNN